MRIRRLWPALAAAFLLGACATADKPAATPEPEDPTTWLEDVTSDRALAWVRERNAESHAVLAAQPRFEATKARLLEVLQARDRIPSIERIGGHVYNLWTDQANPRGLWRRTTWADYRAERPQWETVLDLDALGKAEGESWVWKGATCLPARTAAAMDRCLLNLSRGGSDAKVVREFDLVRKAFVPGGFSLPEAKSLISWVDRDQIEVATDFGPGSLTRSGYARTFKRWQRGTPLASAATVFEIGVDDVYTDVWVDPSPGFDRRVYHRAIDFYRTEVFAWHHGRLQKIPKPDDARIAYQRELLFLQLRSAWTVDGTTYPAGALLATDFDAMLRGERKFDVLFTPTATRSLSRWGVQFTRNQLLVGVQDNVVAQVEELRRVDGRWQRRVVPTPGAGQVRTTPLLEPGLESDPLGDIYLLTYSDFLTPDSLYAAQAGTEGLTLLKRRTPMFDATGMRAEQQFAISRDGTRVPYFVVWPRGATASGDNPTLLYGYGGFQISMLPTYQSQKGDAWLARGGVYVVANIRGGGEFGPEWHRAALRENKQRSYDDFIAVAEDLVKRKVTSPRHLGVQGGSNGGLLVGAMLTQRPDLFGAAVAQVPLLDMRRYHRLLAGASWMAEYGDPDKPEDWSFMSRYSPYHQLRTDQKYPLTLFTTSTRDDRVHPAHARKMVARMREQGHPVLYYENIEGGHGGAADAAQAAHLQALEFSYLWMRLGPASTR